MRCRFHLLVLLPEGSIKVVKGEGGGGKNPSRSISGIELTLLKIIKEQSGRLRQAREKLPALSTGSISNFTSLMPENGE